MLEPGDVGPYRPQPGCIVSIAYLLTATPCDPVPNPANPGNDDAAAPASDHMDMDVPAAGGPLAVNGTTDTPTDTPSAHADGAAAAASLPGPAANGQGTGSGGKEPKGIGQHAEQAQGMANGMAEGSGGQGSAGRGRLLLEAQGAARFEYGAGGVAPEVEALVDEIGGVGGCARCTVRLVALGCKSDHIHACCIVPPVS